MPPLQGFCRPRAAPVNPDKAQLRPQYRQLRRLHAPALQRWLEQAGPVLQPSLRRALALAGPGERHVGLAWPLPGEPDLRPWLLSSGLPLALPAVVGNHLLFRPWRDGQLLAPDACGIPAPTARAGHLQPQQMGLLLIPALAIDRRGVRLGYGGGWYDRLRADPAGRRLPALAVLPQACVVPELPCDPWDVPLNGWISEQGWHALQTAP